MKLSRRDFLKRLSLIGAIAPFIDIDKLSQNLPDFTTEQLEKLAQVEKVEECQPGPYMAYDAPVYYRVIMRDGRMDYYSRSELIQRYGSFLSCINNKDVAYVHPGVQPANWND